MKAKIIVLLVLLINGGVFMANAQWNQLADYPGWVTQSPFDFSIEEYGYIGSGTSYYHDMYKYDPSDDSWTQLNNVPFGLSGPISEVYHGKAYVGIGFEDTSMSMELWEYTPSTDNWVALANCPALPTTTNGYYYHCNEQSFVLDDNMYIILPKREEPTPGSVVYISELWMYNITTDSWIQKNNMPVYFDTDLAFSVNETAYVIGSDNIDYPPYDSVYVYDIVNDSWSVIPNSTAPYNFVLGVGFVIENNIYVGMALGTGCCDKFYKYNTVTNIWTNLEDILDENVLDEGSAFSINGIGYMGLGDDAVNGTGTNRFWAKYTPQTTDINTKISSEDYVLVYPNPASSYLQINNEYIPISNIHIIDIMGKIIYSNILASNGKIDISNLAKGVYFIKIDNKVEKFIKK